MKKILGLSVLLAAVFMSNTYARFIMEDSGCDLYPFYYQVNKSIEDYTYSGYYGQPDSTCYPVSNNSYSVLGDWGDCTLGHYSVGISNAIDGDTYSWSGSVYSDVLDSCGDPRAIIHSLFSTKEINVTIPGGSSYVIWSESETVSPVYYEDPQCPYPCEIPDLTFSNSLMAYFSPKTGTGCTTREYETKVVIGGKYVDERTFTIYAPCTCYPGSQIALEIYCSGASHRQASVEIGETDITTIVDANTGWLCGGSSHGGRESKSAKIYVKPLIYECEDEDDNDDCCKADESQTITYSASFYDQGGNFVGSDSVTIIVKVANEDMNARS